MPVVTIRDILETAIRMEQQGRAFYLEARNLVEMPGARELLDELAQDEIEHEALFRGLLDKDDYSSLAKGPVPQDLRLAEYLIAMPLTTESTPQDILIHAIKMEKNAVELYEAWKTLYEDTELEPLIAGLVAEEKRHRARLEAVYNDNFLKDW